MPPHGFPPGRKEILALKRPLLLQNLLFFATSV
jgi:hypothetical protein